MSKLSLVSSLWGVATFLFHMGAARLITQFMVKTYVGFEAWHAGQYVSKMLEHALFTGDSSASIYDIMSWLSVAKYVVCFWRAKHVRDNVNKHAEILLTLAHVSPKQQKDIQRNYVQYCEDRKLTSDLFASNTNVAKLCIQLLCGLLLLPLVFQISAGSVLERLRQQNPLPSTIQLLLWVLLIVVDLPLQHFRGLHSYATSICFNLVAHGILREWLLATTVKELEFTEAFQSLLPMLCVLLYVFARTRLLILRNLHVQYVMEFACALESFRSVMLPFAAPVAVLYLAYIKCCNTTLHGMDRLWASQKQYPISIYLMPISRLFTKNGPIYCWFREMPVQAIHSEFLDYHDLSNYVNSCALVICLFYWASESCRLNDLKIKETRRLRALSNKSTEANFPAKLDLPRIKSEAKAFEEKIKASKKTKKRMDQEVDAVIKANRAKRNGVQTETQDECLQQWKLKCRNNRPLPDSPQEQVNVTTPIATHGAQSSPNSHTGALSADPAPVTGSSVDVASATASATALAAALAAAPAANDLDAQCITARKLLAQMAAQPELAIIQGMAFICVLSLIVPHHLQVDVMKFCVGANSVVAATDIQAWWSWQSGVSTTQDLDALVCTWNTKV